MASTTVTLAFETPLKNLDLQVKFGDYLFAEADWLNRYPEYADFIQTYGENMPVYLDNSAWLLGESIDVKEFISIIEGLRPQVVVVPDAKGSRDKTIRLVKQFFEAGPPKDGIKYMVVPQGKNSNDWIACFQTIVRMFRHDFQMVGLPRIMYPTRLQLARHVQAFCKKPTHILGCVDPSEITGILASSNATVASIDTSWPARLALGKKRDERIDFENDFITFDAFQNALSQFLKIITPGRPNYAPTESQIVIQGGEDEEEDVNLIARVMESQQGKRILPGADEDGDE